VKESALALKSKIYDMSDPEVSGFHSKAITVSNENILSARLLNENTDTLPQIIEFKVNVLAGIQINKGRDLLDTSKALPAGEYKFNAYLGDETYSFTFENKNRMDNQETMNRFAEFLNNFVPNIHASIEPGNKNNYSRLVIASDLSGRFGDKKFSFEDVDVYSEGIADFFGMNRVEQDPTCARFELNDISKKTATNSFTLENTLSINLNSSSEQPVTIRLVPDSEKVLSAVTDVLDSYNELIRLAKTRTTDSKEHYKATKLINEMKSLEDMYGEELSACGFLEAEDGTLELEESLAIQAARDGGMESLFTRENGFIARLLDKAGEIAINPMEYIEKTIVTYPDNSKIGFRNPYITSMYSGLFFNSYC
jgi:flagellar hook-associated protein 2